MAKNSKTGVEHAVGKRKNAIARVYMRPGTGAIIVNGRTLDDYMIRATSRMVVTQALDITGQRQNYDVRVNVSGGGLNGQAGAIRHGISKILSLVEPETRKQLKGQGLLTRDARKKERKLYGQKGSRARFQFSKR